jgi:hypothetical protein
LEVISQYYDVISIFQTLTIAGCENALIFLIRGKQKKAHKAPLMEKDVNPNG